MQRRGLLLDRDGVINVDRGYTGAREEFEFMPGLFPFLNAAQDLGFRLAVLTNQAGVARGFYTVAAYEKLTAWMRQELAAQGIIIDLVLACFEHPEGAKAEYRRESFWRKPNPGMVLQAVRRLNLDPARSAFIGDQPRDMEAATAGGIGMCLYLSKDARNMPQDITVIENFDAALRNLHHHISAVSSALRV